MKWKYLISIQLVSFWGHHQHSSLFVIYFVIFYWKKWAILSKVLYKYISYKFLRLKKKTWYQKHISQSSIFSFSLLIYCHNMKIWHHIIIFFQFLWKKMFYLFQFTCTWNDLHKTSSSTQNVNCRILTWRLHYNKLWTITCLRNWAGEIE